MKTKKLNQIKPRMNLRYRIYERRVRTMTMGTRMVLCARWCCGLGQSALRKPSKSDRIQVNPTKVPAYCQQPIFLATDVHRWGQERFRAKGTKGAKNAVRPGRLRVSEIFILIPVVIF